MGKNKNNQATEYFSYKNDDKDLVQLGDFLRDTLGFKVEREWFIVFDKFTGRYIGYQKTFNDVTRKYKVHNPDLILIDKKTRELKLVIEIDGAIHHLNFLDTQERNQDYFLAGVPLLVIEMSEVTVSLEDLAYRKINEKLGL